MLSSPSSVSPLSISIGSMDLGEWQMSLARWEDETQKLPLEETQTGTELSKA